MIMIIYFIALCIYAFAWVCAVLLYAATVAVTVSALALWALGKAIVTRLRAL